LPSPSPNWRGDDEITNADARLASTGEQDSLVAQEPSRDP
jgi:hypothetical protein